MPSPRTTVTELATGLGMLGHPSVDEALAARPAEMVSVSPETWDLLGRLRAGGAHGASFDAAFANGAAFLAADDGLRGRRPRTVEWKGSGRAPGDDVAPVDLRVDHVYLVSCKYLSKILYNASPAHLFDELLAGRHGRRSADWYEACAPAEYQALYRAVRAALGDPGLPAAAGELGTEGRRHLAAALAGGWPGGCADAYRSLAEAVARASAARWSAALGAEAEREGMLWRLLRMGAAPYFVLGSAGDRLLRLRIATPWDWRQEFRLVAFEVARPVRGPAPGGLAGGGAPPGQRAGPLGDRPRRGPLEPRPLRRAPRGQGLPRHPPRRRPGLLPPGARRRLADRRT